MCWRHELHCLGFINDGNVMLNHGWWEVSLIQNVSLECENMSADDNINQNCSENILRHRSLSAQPISTRKAQLRKQIPQTFAHLVNFSKNVSAMFDNHTILLLWLQNKQTFHMFSLCDLRFSCSVLLISTCYMRKGSWAFYLNYPQINEVGKSDQMVLFNITQALEDT